jgi:hypothetical protein
MSKKPDLSNRINKLIRNVDHPSSIEDFLSDNNSPREVNYLKKENEKIYKREEFRFTKDFSEKLRQASFSLKKKKTEIVQEALLDYYIKMGI